MHADLPNSLSAIAFRGEYNVPLRHRYVTQVCNMVTYRLCISCLIIYAVMQFLSPPALTTDALLYHQYL